MKALNRGGNDNEILRVFTSGVFTDHGKSPFFPEPDHRREKTTNQTKPLLSPIGFF